MVAHVEPQSPGRRVVRDTQSQLRRISGVDGLACGAVDAVCFPTKGVPTPLQKNADRGPDLETTDALHVLY